ncbi:uncharacterized protein LOC132183283 [Corylus avellana]|uniref:uncharacterized protein LOC132183283 n=1 Tax=Corylus avellana TaxID=13451 RepID=UPI001E230BB8|nr:uncharacterized protein LOC132183283 [Corylus avellana]
MEYWSPQDAMKAYLHTLRLCKIHNYKDCNGGSSNLIEPKYFEFISALAAGKRARLMVEITSDGITPLTIALAVAAKQTGGRFVCILPEDCVEKNRAGLMGNGDDLEDMVEFVYGNPCKVIKQYVHIDFAVIDCKVNADHQKLFKSMKLNPSGSIVVVNNLHHRRERISFPEVVKGRIGGVKSVTLPIGQGMELTRIGSGGKRERRRYNRFHVTFEN